LDEDTLSQTWSPIHMIWGIHGLMCGLIILG
jgi:hypothetical protein